MNPPENRGRHLVHSHAKEGDIPGTVDLSTREGDDTGYGQALYPVPAEDPNDPLQWSSARKSLILLVCSVYSFLSNSALLGPAVYIGIYAEEFGVSPNTASNLISYANLAFGFGSLLLVPAYHKFGRRPVMLASLVVYCAGLIACSQVTTYGGLMAARVVHGFASSVCEALPVQLVNDIFFLHERGKRLGYYTVCLCIGSTGPLYAGYMLAGGYSWRLFFYVEFAFGCALLVLAFFVVEETLYHRKPRDESAVHESSSSQQDKKNSISNAAIEDVSATTNADAIPPRKTFLQTLKFWGVYDRDTEFFLMIARSFTYFLVPHVLWVITTYGIYIGLGALTFNYTFPLKITAPPYSWSQTSSGLIAVASLLGYLLAIPFTTSSDRLAARLTRRNNSIREAEMRLGVMLPVVLIAPAGLIVYGLAAERNLHWVAYFAGVAMNNFAAYFFFTFTLAYAIDSHTANVSEMLIAMNLGKQAISFGMGLDLLQWVLQHGYAVMIAGVFCAVVFVNNLAVVVFMLWGKKIRRFMATTWLARVHRASVKEVATH
ncbi:major facilitator superfamily domain-containing protein [Corynascus novoguineensis]|uniref:Major facilitator superfamily domain-containing protein n=1 Tax=Corynascus novoguineensis TaxID=1126955 RepID=A0AAN7CMM6_9PEZI|nr:major facilitator superfamily domain-containing protein [Corynascus novoguineensis]